MIFNSNKLLNLHMFSITVILLIILICLIIIYRLKRKNLEKEKEYDLKQKEESFNNKIHDMQFEVIKTLVNLMEIKDPYTAGHSERVTMYAMEFADYLKLSNKEKKILRYAAILHDVGKLILPIEILHKKERLTTEEFEEIKRHPSIGCEILKDIEFLDDELDLIKHHHERVDGKGYPDGLKGDGINVLCRLITNCDSFDAMISNRAYRTKMNLKQAVAELERNAGSQFDYNMVKQFVQYINFSNING